MCGAFDSHHRKESKKEGAFIAVGASTRRQNFMTDKIITAMKKHRLLLVFLVAAFVKQILVINVPICALPGTPCDDELMRDWAFSIAGMDWLGDFNVYTFLKEPGFAIFLGVCYRLHIPYIFAVTLCYSVACMIFSTALRNIFSSGKYVLLVYLFLLFHPISYCSSVLQKVYRNGLGVILTLCIFGGLLHMYFSLRGEKAWRLFFWSAFTGLSLGYLWITKGDTAWLLPFTGVICLVMLGILLVKCRNLRNLPRYLCLAIPFLGVLLCIKGVDFLHTQRYGISSLEYYATVMDEVSHIRQEGANEKIPLTRKKLKELYQVSPTLASVQEYLEKEMDEHNTYDTNPTDGEVEAGWLGWTLVRAFYDAGMYEDSETADTFFRNLHEDLAVAFADGRLERVEESAVQKYYMDTPAHRRELIGRTLQTLDYMISYRRTYVSMSAREVPDSEECIWAFERVTGNTHAHLKAKHDYAIAGWILFPDYDGQKMSVYIEDEKGNRYKKIGFKKSGDIYEFLKGTGRDLKSARKCRFHTGWDAEDSTENTVWYLGLYEKNQADGAKVGERKARIQIGKDGFIGEGTVEFDGALDVYNSQKDRERVENSAVMPVQRLNLIRVFYRATGKVMFWFGILAYAVLTIVVLRGLRRKTYEYVNPWLIVTGLSLSVLVLAFGIAYVDLTQCPAIKTHYLSSGYPLIISAELISLCKCAELLAVHLQRVRELLVQYRMARSL